MTVFASVAIMFIGENPAADFANMDRFVEVSFDGHCCGAMTTDKLAAVLHFAKTLLPDSHVPGAQVDIFSVFPVFL